MFQILMGVTWGCTVGVLACIISSAVNPRLSKYTDTLALVLYFGGAFCAMFSIAFIN